MSEDQIFQAVGALALLAYLGAYMLPWSESKRNQVRMAAVVAIGVACLVAIALYLVG